MVTTDLVAGKRTNEAKAFLEDWKAGNDVGAFHRRMIAQELGLTFEQTSHLYKEEFDALLLKMVLERLK